MNQSTATTSNYHKTSKNHLKINASVKSTARHTTAVPHTPNTIGGRLGGTAATMPVLRMASGVSCPAMRPACVLSPCPPTRNH